MSRRPSCRYVSIFKRDSWNYWTDGHLTRFQQVSVGTREVSINPSEEIPQTKAPTVSITTEDLSLRNGQHGNSYVLLLRVSSPITEDTEPAAKRRRLSQTQEEPTSSRLYGAELAINDRHSRCLLIDGDYELALKELNPVELNPSAAPDKSPRKGVASWNTLDRLPPTMSSTHLIPGPVLKFRLQWADEPCNTLVDRYVAKNE